MNPLAVAAVAIVALFAWMKRGEEPEEPGALTPSFKPNKPADPDSDGGLVPSQPEPIFPVTPNPAPVPAQPVPSVPNPSGNPPNVSGDPAGYNTGLYPTAKAVRKGLVFLGELGTGYVDVVPSPSVLKAAVKSFQGNYNSASLEGLWEVSGWLTEDGVPGVNTLRALEIAVSGLDGLGLDDTIRGYQWSEEFDL
jgi:hypothetical protein